MKKTLKFWMAVSLGVMLTWMACEPGAEEDPNPNNNNNNNQDTTGVVNNDTVPPSSSDLDLNALTDDLIIANATKIPGAIPAVTNMIDLKIDRDTIFLTDGVKTRIRIRYPENVAVGSSFFMQIVGADDYFEVEFEEEEESDSIAVLYLEIDPDDWDPPFSFDLKFVPADESGLPGDEIITPVVVEPSGSCEMPNENLIYEWIYTIQDGSFYLGPMYPQTVSGTVSGCCDTDGNSYYSDCIGTPSHAQVDYESVFMVKQEYIKLFNDGFVAGELAQYTRNVRPSESDFCGGAAGYTESSTHNAFSGTFTFNAGDCSLQIESLEGLTAPIIASDGTVLGELPLPIYVGAGPFTKYEIISPHFIREIRGGVEGEGSLERMYEGRNNPSDWVD